MCLSSLYIIRQVLAVLIIRTSVFVGYCCWQYQHDFLPCPSCSLMAWWFTFPRPTRFHKITSKHKQQQQQQQTALSDVLDPPSRILKPPPSKNGIECAV
mmetsp:Transcript_20817/g.23276  ORF Transcript_20817/g.23276 Transcript_20817/m.23276 type:complete len:99 (+) Transcript_20817:36-332(+)